MRERRRIGRRLRRLATLTALLVWSFSGTTMASDLDRIETEFEKAIRNVSPATVICVPADVKPGRGVQIGTSSGVVIHRKGWILSDGDVGVWLTRAGRDSPIERHETNTIEVRLPDLSGRGFREYAARVIVRNKRLDTSLLKLEKPPSGLKALAMADSDDLRVGQFAFAMGNSFGMAAEAPPTLTAGMVSSLVPAAKASDGKWDEVYTSAAVNPGVNGGPLVDARCRLVAIISGPVPPWDPSGNADQPYQFLGKAIPIRRLAAWYSAVPEAKGLFDGARTRAPVAPRAAALELVVQQAAQSAYRVLVSIEVQRKEPYKEIAVVGQRGLGKLPRYSGPVSGMIVSQDGHVLTSLYNLTNVFALGSGRPLPQGAPEALKPEHLLASIQGIKVWLPDASFSWARLVARHDGLGLALLQLVEEKPAAPSPQPPAASTTEGEPKKDEPSGDESSSGDAPKDQAPKDDAPKEEAPEDDAPKSGDTPEDGAGEGEAKPAEGETPASGEESAPPSPADAPKPQAAAPAKPRTYAVKPLPVVPEDFYTAGRFVVAAGHPFGGRRLPDPLVAFGVLSKQHPLDATDRWAGAWQTDASLTDATCGGAAVDLEGRMIGMLQLWAPSRHGRNSGIGFIVPWSQIEEVLPQLMQGRDFRAPFLGIEWAQGADAALTIARVIPGTAAAKAGLMKDDVIVAMDGVAMDSLQQAGAFLRRKWSGDRVTITVERGSDVLDLEAVLGVRE